MSNGTLATVCAGCAEKLKYSYQVEELYSGDRPQPCPFCGRYFTLSTYKLTRQADKYRQQRRGGGERYKASRP